MTNPARPVEHRLRVYLLAMAALVAVATLIELWLTDHVEGFVQLVPFFLCGLALIVVLAVLYAPRRGVVLALRVVMAAVLLGSLYGVYEHVAHNWAFEREIRPNATAGEAFWHALSGASPLLAPGMLAFAALLGLGATYRHPALMHQLPPRRPADA